MGRIALTVFPPQYYNIELPSDKDSSARCVCIQDIPLFLDTPNTPAVAKAGPNHFNCYQKLCWLLLVLSRSLLRDIALKRRLRLTTHAVTKVVLSPWVANFGSDAPDQAKAIVWED